MTFVRRLPLAVHLALIVWLLAAAAATAQTAPSVPTQKSAGAQEPKTTPPADAKAAAASEPAQPPETKALRDASRISDPDKQLEALKKIVADFPKTAAASSAENLMVGALARKTTSDIKALQEAAKKSIEGAATPNERARRMGSAASSFSGAGVLLDEAAQYAKTSLELLADEPAWIAAERRAAADARAEAPTKDPSAKPRPEISDADYSTRLTSARQSGLITLAQVFEKQGQAAAAEKTYREAYALSSRTGGAAALKLADYAKAAGYPFEQLEYLTAATLAGRVTAASRAELEAVYKKTHGGTPADLDRMLDERYEKGVTRVEAQAYMPTSKRTDRVVLAELFTGAGCPPCVAADLAIEAALERYTPKDIAVLVYHLHIPRPDPMANPSTIARKDFYDVPGTPTYFIDGGNQQVGGGAASAAQRIFADTVQEVVDKRLEVKPGANVMLTGAMHGDKVEVAARVVKAGMPGQKLRLQIALVEELVRYTGENGVRFHPMVVRSLASAGKHVLGFPLAPGKRVKTAYTFDVAGIAADASVHLDEMEGGSSQRFGKFQFVERKSDINRDNLRIVGWVQDEETKEVLQVAAVDLKPSAARAR